MGGQNRPWLVELWRLFYVGQIRGAGELTKEIYRLAFVFSRTAKGAPRS